MINLNVFNGKELQNMQALLNLFEGEGLTDIRFVRERIANHITNELLDGRVASIPIKKLPSVKPIRDSKVTCPKCGKEYLRQVHNEEGLNIVGCLACRWSKLVSEKEK